MAEAGCESPICIPIETSPLLKGTHHFSRQPGNRTMPHLATPPNTNLVLDNSTYGMLESSDLLQNATDIRLTCNDTTRNLSARAIWTPSSSQLNQWLAETSDQNEYQSSPYTVSLSKNGGAFNNANVYFSHTENAFFGSWHVCGKLDGNQRRISTWILQQRSWFWRHWRQQCQSNHVGVPHRVFWTATRVYARFPKTDDERQWQPVDLGSVSKDCHQQYLTPDLYR